LWFPEITEEDPDDLDNLQYAHASLMHLGYWPANSLMNPDLEAWQDFDIGLWVPTGTPTETESTATWANRWASTTTSGTGYLSALTMPDWSASSSRDYCNWSIMTTLSSSAAAASSMGLRKFMLAAKDESSLLASTGQARWRYFAGKDMGAAEYPGGDNTDVPLTDLKPRLWVICTRMGETYEYTGSSKPTGDPIGGNP
jgi:hypothetical protein